MREGWKSVRIKDVARVVNGGTPKTKVSDYWGGHHLWITPAEMGRLVSPYLHESKRKLTDAGLQNCSASLVPAHSVILSTRAPIGHLVINSVPMAFNQGCRGLVPSEKILYKYLYYFLGFSVDLLNDLGSGTTFKELSAGKLKSVEIPLPSFPEQKRIVAILDEAFAGIDTAIANTEKNLANARELFESYLNSVFSQRGEGWTESQLLDICSDIFAGGDVPKGNWSKNATEKHKIPIYTNGEKNRGLYGYTENARVTTPSITISARGTIGYSEIRSECYYPAVRLIVVIPKTDLVSVNFLYYAIKSSEIGHSGTSIPQLTVPMVRSILISYPSLAKQETIAARLSDLFAEVQCLERLYQQKLTALAELKQSLLQKAFSGELTADAAEDVDTAEAELA